MVLEHSNSKEVYTVPRKYNQSVLCYQQVSAFHTQRRRITSRDQKLAATGNGLLWHVRLGHPRAMTLHKLQTVLGVRLKGPKTAECESYSRAKINQQISRRPTARERDIPCYKVWVDWTDLEEDYDSLKRTLFVIDA